MRWLNAITSLVILVASPTDAAVLKGVVVENEVGGPAAANVEITSTGANPKETRNDGQFMLDFPDKKPGDIVHVVVSKVGYVVVNDVQLEQVLPTNPDVKPLLILLCRETNREEMKRRYYRLRSSEAIEANYQRRMKEQQAASAESISRLQQERDQAKGAALTATEELARAKPGQTSVLYDQAMRLFLDGQIEQALKALDYEQMRRNLAGAKRREEDSYKEQEQTAQSYELKARLFIIQVGIDDSTSNGNGADALINLGVRQSTQNQMDAARKAFEEALKIHRELALKNPVTYLPRVANTLNNLGVLQSTQNQMDAARKAFEEEVEIRRDLARKNPDTYTRDLATALTNLAVLHRDQNRRDDARNAFEEALEKYRDLARMDPKTYFPDVAATLNNLGNLHQVANRVDAARRVYREALDLYQLFTAQDPDQFRAQVAKLKGLLKELGDQPDP